jgi:signal transduction histidine kinase/ActR/RegA family two-component response regulator
MDMDEPCAPPTGSWQRIAPGSAELQCLVEHLRAEVSIHARLRNEQEALFRHEQSLRAKAEQLSRAKDEFLATLSHELRTPLNAMFGWVMLLRSGRLDPAGEARALEAIQRNVDTQKRLIEDLLDVSRIVAGRLQLDLTVVDPAGIVNAALETVDPAAEAKGVTLIRQLESNAGAVRADCARLQQVVCNILTNAIKFTPAGGQVEALLARSCDQIEISIQDDGPGIPAELLPHVFDPFWQQERAVRRREGGLGLGLAIARHLVELHGGTIEASSAGPGRGSRFAVHLPRISIPAISATPQPAFSAVDAVLAGVRVLAVDDDPEARELLSALLHSFGAEVRLAETGEGVLAMLRTQSPDILVCDLAMPGIDGYTLIERIRALSIDDGGRIPAVAATAHASDRDRARALAAGFQAHLAKPVHPRELVSVIASLLGRETHWT